MILTLQTNSRIITFDDISKIEYYQYPIDLGDFDDYSKAMDKFALLLGFKEIDFDNRNNLRDNYEFRDIKLSDDGAEFDDFRERRMVGFISHGINYIITYDCECYVENDKGNTIANYSLRKTVSSGS